MKTVNEMKLCVPSKSCNEAFARCVVSAFVMSLDPTVNELSDLKTAVSEAVTNCIVHGYRHQSSYAELLRQGACPFKARQRNNRNS